MAGRDTMPPQDLREQIVRKIRQLAEANNGRPPGRMTFERETGIREGAWRGVYWGRWGDALTEAGFAPNAKSEAIDEKILFEKLVSAFRHYGRVATEAELRMYRKIDKNFPAHTTFSNRFPSKAEMLIRLREWAISSKKYEDVAAMLDGYVANTPLTATTPRVDGYVYLLGSGAYFKIGRSDDLERRVKEIRVALPDSVSLIHSIQTDDPAGIEAYWHRRFADRRANGEWFKLSPADIAAFKRRKFQ